MPAKSTTPGTLTTPGSPSTPDATAREWSNLLDQLALDAAAAANATPHVLAENPNANAGWQPPRVPTTLPHELAEQAAATRATISEAQRALGEVRDEILASLHSLERRRGALHAYDAQAATPPGGASTPDDAKAPPEHP